MVLRGFVSAGDGRLKLNDSAETRHRRVVFPKVEILFKKYSLV